jgi:hypothetical protein
MSIMPGRESNVSADDWVEVETKRPETKYVEVTITDADIANGVRSPFDWKTDPESLAIKRTLNCSFAISGWAIADSWDNNIKTQWSLSPYKEIQKWCQDWQTGHPVKPLTFKMYKVGEVDVKPKEFKGKVRRYKNRTDELIDQQRFKLE